MILLIGLNIFKGKEPKISYTIGTLAQSLKENNIDFDIIDLNLNESIENSEVDFIIENLKKFNFKEFDFVGISVFVWNRRFINALISFIRKKNSNIKIILGGPQITYSTDRELKEEYPRANYFVRGFGEKSLVQILKNKVDRRIVNSNIFELSDCQSPYKNIIEVRKYQKMVRMETKRGCPYNCAFCSHFDNNFRNKVICLKNERIIEDLIMIKNQKVKEANIIDPLFNIQNAQWFLEKIIEFDIKNTKFKFQTRYELMSDNLIELCSKANVHLEFGLQTADEKVGEFIDRKNNLEKVKLVMKKLNECKISYETSIIYGLPYQTFKSFENTIEFILKYGNNQIVTFPLGLLVGTKLYNLRKNLGFKTLRMSRFDTPIIVKNNWFSFKTWQKMDKIAKEIKNIQLCEKSLL